MIVTFDIADGSFDFYSKKSGEPTCRVATRASRRWL